MDTISYSIHNSSTLQTAYKLITSAFMMLKLSYRQYRCGYRPSRKRVIAHNSNQEKQNKNCSTKNKKLNSGSGMSKPSAEEILLGTYFGKIKCHVAYNYLHIQALMCFC